jgi:hypothetical protein
VLAAAREERERHRHDDQITVDETLRQRLAAMTTDFRRLWADTATANRDRKRILAQIIEDATLVKIPAEGITKIYVRFKGGKTETLTAVNPKSSAQQITTAPEVVALIDRLLEDHVLLSASLAVGFSEFRLRVSVSAAPARAGRIEAGLTRVGQNTGRA